MKATVRTQATSGTCGHRPSRLQPSSMPFVEVTRSREGYQVGAERRCGAARARSGRRAPARWWRSSAPPASGRARCCTCSAGSTAPIAGTVRIGEAELTQLTDAALVAFRNRHVGFVFQFHHLLPEFTALENAEMPLRIARVPAAEARAAGRASCCARVGLGERLTHRPGHAVGRRAAARGGRARARDAAGAAAGRRADRRPRRAHRRRRCTSCCARCTASAA